MRRAAPAVGHAWGSAPRASAAGAALLLAAVAFVALAARTSAPTLALCAGVCGVAAGRVVYGTAREAG